MAKVTDLNHEKTVRPSKGGALLLSHQALRLSQSKNPEVFWIRAAPFPES
jgi:hypothetical protein